MIKRYEKRQRILQPEEQKKTRENLLKYCGPDPLAMVKLWEKLKELGSRE